MAGPSALTLPLFIGFWGHTDGHWCIEGVIKDELNVCSTIALEARRGYEMALWISSCGLTISENIRKW
jgi:hypothetical protein